MNMVPVVAVAVHVGGVGEARGKPRPEFRVRQLVHPHARPHAGQTGQVDRNYPGAVYAGGCVLAFIAARRVVEIDAMAAAPGHAPPGERVAWV